MNLVNLVRFQELREPLKRQGMCPFKAFTQFPMPEDTLNVTCNPKVMKTVLRGARSDGELFEDIQNGKVFFPILIQLFPDEELSKEDFLLTCSKDFVRLFRKPILEFLGPNKIRSHREEIERVVTDTVKAWKELGTINCAEASQVYTTSVISTLLLDHPGPSGVYRVLSDAIDFINKYTMKKTFRLKILDEEEQKYQKSLSTMREAIETSLQVEDNAFIQELREEGMSEIQVKTTLFLMYLAGIETSSSLLTYLLWQLGKNPAYQKKIFDEIHEHGDSPLSSTLATVGRLYSESIRLFTPLFVYGRSTVEDVICVTKDIEGNELSRTFIGKGESVVSSPSFAARDPEIFDDPNTFNPDRFEQVPKSFSWLPFSDGVHSCPGRWLAKEEITLLVTELVRNFQLTSSPEEVTQKGFLTLKLGEKVNLSLIPRSPSSC